MKQVGRRAAVLLGKADAEQARGGGLAVELARKLLGLVPGGDVRRDLARHEAAHGVAQRLVLVGERGMRFHAGSNSTSSCPGDTCAPAATCTALTRDGAGSVQHVLHLHRFQHDERAPGLDAVAGRRTCTATTRPFIGATSRPSPAPAARRARRVRRCSVRLWLAPPRARWICRPRSANVTASSAPSRRRGRAAGRSTRMLSTTAVSRVAARHASAERVSLTSLPSKLHRHRAGRIVAPGIPFAVTRALAACSAAAIASVAASGPRRLDAQTRGQERGGRDRARTRHRAAPRRGTPCWSARRAPPSRRARAASRSRASSRVRAMRDELGDHRVVVAARSRRRDSSAWSTRTPGRGLPQRERPACGRKSRAGSSAHSRASMAWPREADVRLRQRQRLAGRDAQLPFDQVEPGDHLGHRMLDLQPRVHLHEVELARRRRAGTRRCRRPT